MPKPAHQNPFDAQAHVYTQGKFWPVELEALDPFHARLHIDADVELRDYDRIGLKFGTLPSFPALVSAIKGTVVELQFLGPVHPAVIEAVEHGDLPLRSPDLAA